MKAPVYIVDMILRECGDTLVIPLATKCAVMHMTDIPAFEYMLKLKGRELIKDAEFISGKK